MITPDQYHELRKARKPERAIALLSAKQTRRIGSALAETVISMTRKGATAAEIRAAVWWATEQAIERVDASERPRNSHG